MKNQGTQVKPQLQAYLENRTLTERERERERERARERKRERKRGREREMKKQNNVSEKYLKGGLCNYLFFRRVAHPWLDPAH